MVHKFVGAPPKAKLEELIATHSASISPVPGITDTIENSSADGSATATAPPTRPANAKPIEEALKPMKKEWLPPGMSRKE